MRRKRPLGHDLVVATLVLLSCSERSEKEAGRDVAVQVDTPVKARVDRVRTEVIESAGCRCNTNNACDPHCMPSQHDRFACELVVERSGPPARAKTSCAADGTVRLELDPAGERLATTDGLVWSVFAGGWDGGLARAEPIDLAQLDWTKIPSAREIIKRDLGKRLTQAHYTDVPRRVELAGLFSSLGHVAPTTLGEDLAALAHEDWGFDWCPRHGSSWGDYYEKQAPETKSAVKAQLALLLKGPLGADQWHETEHAARVLDAKEILLHAGEPKTFLEVHENGKDRATQAAAAAVLQAWSQTAPAAAAAYACEELPEIGKSPLEDAAFAAIAHAKLNCPTAKTRAPRWCDDIYAIKNLEDDQQDVKPDTAFCEPWEGFLLTQRLTDRKFDAEAFHVLCRKAAHLGQDAAPEEDDD